MDRYYSYAVINLNEERPTKEEISFFKEISVNLLCKLTNSRGLMLPGFKTLIKGSKLVGAACTTYGRQGDTLMLQRIGDMVQPGDVVVADVGGTEELSVIGERLTYYICKIRGAIGLVINGAIRDKLGLIDMNVPIFYKGIDPKLFGAIGPGAINVPIQCGGIIVNPGDLIIADDDGIVSIPKSEIKMIMKELEGYDK